MLSLLTAQGKQIVIGNILFIVCCGFYLAWWLLAFKPDSAITGIKTGWLLLPACFAGLLGVILALSGILAKTPGRPLLPRGFILFGGIALFCILLAVTVLLLRRPATSELLLIVGWSMLAVAEINTLFGAGFFSHRLSVGFLTGIGVVLIVSLVCYTLYYRLDSRAGYIDGMIPLILGGLTMAGISLRLLLPV